MSQLYHSIVKVLHSLIYNFATIMGSFGLTSLAGFPASLRWGYGPIAHLVERFYGIEEVRGSIPLRSTTIITHPATAGGLRVQISFGPQLHYATSGGLWVSRKAGSGFAMTIPLRSTTG